MPENIINVRLKIKNVNIRKELEQVISTLKEFSIQNPDNSGGCDLLIQEIGDDLKNEFRLIHALQNSAAVKEVFLTSSRTEPEILIQALQLGIKEFFTQPIKEEEVKQALLKCLKRNDKVKESAAKSKQGKIINVIGSKGGVGTTTIAVNLATCLNELEGVNSVALVDMNLLFGEIPLFLDTDPAFNWGEITKNISRLDSTYLMGILSKHPSGVYMLPSPTNLERENVASPEIIEKLFSLMQTEFDFIVIDSGQSLDDISLKILELSDTVLLISILSLPCLINVKRLMETFWGLGYPQEERVKIIISRYHKKSGISLEEAEKSINKKIFWHIPNDYDNTITAINQGKTLSKVANKAEITKNFREFASTIIDKQRGKRKRAVFGLKF